MKIKINRNTPLNKTGYFNSYVEECKEYINEDIPYDSKIICSEDVFKYIVDKRKRNIDKDKEREE